MDGRPSARAIRDAMRDPDPGRVIVDPEPPLAAEPLPGMTSVVFSTDTRYPIRQVRLDGVPPRWKVRIAQNVDGDLHLMLEEPTGG